MEEIAVLVELQAKDTEIMRLRQEAERIPQEIENLGQRLAESRSHLEEIRGAQREMLKKRHQRENDLGQFQEKQDKLRQGLHMIKTNRDYTATLQQVENYRAEIAKIEDDILELMEVGERTEREVKEREQELREEEELVEGGQGLLQTELVQVTETLGRCEIERTALASQVPPNLLARYERIRDHTNGTAVVPVTNGVCGGCFRRLPPQLALEVRMEQDLIACQFCGRVLYAEKEEEREPRHDDPTGQTIRGETPQGRDFHG